MKNRINRFSNLSANGPPRCGRSCRPVEDHVAPGKLLELSMEEIAELEMTGSLIFEIEPRIRSPATETASSDLLQDPDAPIVTHDFHLTTWRRRGRE